MLEQETEYKFITQTRSSSQDGGRDAQHSHGNEPRAFLIPALLRCQLANALLTAQGAIRAGSGLPWCWRVRSRKGQPVSESRQKPSLLTLRFPAPGWESVPHWCSKLNRGPTGPPMGAVHAQSAPKSESFPSLSAWSVMLQ